MIFCLLLNPHPILKMKKHIANFVTSLNILSGCIGIGMVFKGEIDIAAYMIGVAAVFDFMDGMVARLLNVKSGFGKELDSLADVVSFGVLPGIIMYSMLDIAFRENEGISQYIPFVAFIIPVFSALRLAKFNIDSHQSDSFIGMPTPANAIFFASIPLILLHQPEQIPFINNILGNPGILIILIITFSLLLVAPIPLFSLKFKDFSWSVNHMQYILIVSSIILLIFLQFFAIPIIILLYLFLSIINNLIKK
jgi:CDP-diacylglycerol---serine O-phosphatidyltransferase